MTALRKKCAFFEQDLTDLGEHYELFIDTLANVLVPPGATVVDGGANTGRHTIALARRVDGGGTVHAVEPMPDLIAGNRKWADAVRVTDRIVYHQCALWQEDGTSTFNRCLDNPGLSSLRFAQQAHRYQKVEVALRPLDELLPDHDVSFLKIDIEGAEYNALLGSRKLIARSRDIFIVFENARAWAAENFHYSRDDFFGYFASMNMSLFDAFGDEFTPTDWNNPEAGWYFMAWHADWGLAQETVDLARWFWRTRTMRRAPRLPAAAP